MIVVGVDPGLTGAVAGIAPDGALIAPLALDTCALVARKGRGKELSAPMVVRGLDAIVRHPSRYAWNGEKAGAALGHEIFAAVELVGAMPRQGVSSTFKFGKTTGLLIGILAGLSIPVVERTPQWWRAKVGIPNGAGKDASRAKFIELWPQHAGLVARKKDDGIAEAALLAWAYRKDLMENFLD